jgi:hypothetical protein
MDNSLKDSAVDFIFAVVSRREVETGNAEEVLGTLNNLTVNRETALQFLGRVDFRIDGYNADSRGLFEIPEVRSFLRELDSRFPFWFFYLTTKTDALKLFALSLCSITRVSPTATSHDRDDFAAFMSFHFAAMNQLFDSFQLDERLNIERSAELEEYFLGSK